MLGVGADRRPRSLGEVDRSDPCCIDKTNSVELSEAINLMFRLYETSAVCYVYLADVTKVLLAVTFGDSRWFKRGWTLQELLAPKYLVFLDMH